MTTRPLPPPAELETLLLSAMRATGKPRGLTWESIEPVLASVEPVVVLARERGSGAEIALVLVTVRFAAIPGGEMDDVPAVPEIRTGTAILRESADGWRPTGKILFNLTPGESRQHLQDLLAP